MPDYSSIIAVFNRIEVEFPVDSLTYKGLHVWPLIRFDIASQLFWQKQGTSVHNRDIFEQESQSDSLVKEAQRKYVRILADKKRAIFSAELSPLLDTISRADVALLTIGFEYTLINGRFYNRFYDPLKDILDDLSVSYQDILSGFQGNIYENTYREKLTLAAEIAYAQQFMNEFILDNSFKEIITGFDIFLNYLDSHGIVVSVNHELLVNRLEQIMSQSFFFELLLKRIQPRLAFVVCYYHDTAMAFLLACRRVGIPTVDMQHSVICPDDWGWAQWNRVPSDGYELIPRHFWAWGDTYAEITRRWSCKSAPNLEAIMGGNLWIPAWHRQFASGIAHSRRPPVGPEKVVLYAAPFGNAQMFPEIFPDEVLEAIRNSPPTLKWLIRIHYKTDDELMSHIRAYLARYAGEVNLHRSSDIQLYELLETVDYHVSQTCTTVIEAEELGVPNIIIGDEGQKWYQFEIDKGYYFYAGTSKELLDTIIEGRKPISRPEKLLCTETLVAKSALTSLLGLTLAGNAPDYEDNGMSWLLDTGKTKEIQTMSEPEMNDNSPIQINLCCGAVRLLGFINIDVIPGADMQVDLEHELLPFPDGSVDHVVCVSAINYFSYYRAGQIIAEIRRILKPGGVARFATQDLQVLARNYLERNSGFYFEKLNDGSDRFPGRTFADKFNEFFYGFYSGNKHCKYVYDFESLSAHFYDAGFELVEQRKFQESRIPGSEQFDNRSEQMFFLEAVKNKEFRDMSLRDKALSLWNAGERDRGWQLLMKVLKTDPSDRVAVINCAAVLREHKRLDDIARLYRAYLACKPDDQEIRRALEENLSIPLRSEEEAKTILQRQAELNGLNNRLNSVLTDRVHLDAAMAWLRRAQQANPGGGVSALYYMDRKEWDVDYPETTGYIISTFLTYANLSGDTRYRVWACEMGNWEIAIQSPEGGAGEPAGVYGMQPRVFNTAQVILGWAALFQETGKTLYLDAACRAADWIIGNLDADGKWMNGTFSGPRAYKSRVSWALLELYTLTSNEKYRVEAERSIKWILAQANANGWFDNNSLTDPGKPWTHLIGYVLVGLLEICRLNNANFDRGQVLTLLHNAARGMIAHYTAAKERAGNKFVTLAATYDQNWQSNDSWSCVTGTTQVEFFLRRLSEFIDDPLLVRAADRLLNDVKQLQFVDGITDPDIWGGLPASFPIDAPYGPYSIQNWAVKFYADSLLQRLLPIDRQIIIG